MFPSTDAVRQLVSTLTDRVVAWRGGRFTIGDSASTSRPEGVRKLNDSIWQLYSPPLKTQEVEVIFFHGIHKFDSQEAFWKTWFSRDDKVLWPKDWLSKSFPKARILSVSYDSSVKYRNEQLDAFLITENLIQDMITSAHVGLTCPVILVGHSLGSIIIKEFLLGCIKTKSVLDITRNQTRIDEIDKFLGNCKGVFYYSPPHGGSRILDSASPIWSMNEPLVKLLKTLSTETSRINDSFDGVRRNLGIKTHTIQESKQTTFMGITGILVEEASARPDSDVLYTVDADHFEVCKPKDNSTCAIFTHLEAFITEEMKCWSEEETLERAKAWAQGDTELTIAEQDRTILRLVECLHEHGNPDLQGEAAWVMSSLAEMDMELGRKDIRVRIAKKKGAIDGLVRCLSEYSNLHLQEGAAWALCKLFHIGHNNDIRSSFARDIVTEHGAIFRLVKCLSVDSAPDLQEAASWDLCHLTEIDESFKLRIAKEEGAIAGLVKLCLVKTQKREYAAAYTLCSLISIQDHDPIRLRIAKEKGAVAGLVECLSAEDDILRECATVALDNLAITGDRVGDQSIRASIDKGRGARVLR